LPFVQNNQPIRGNYFYNPERIRSTIKDQRNGDKSKDFIDTREKKYSIRKKNYLLDIKIIQEN